MYDRNNALAAADMLQDRVLPFFEQHSLPLLRVLTDRGTEFWGAPEPSSLETNGSCERFHRTIQEAFYAGAFTKKSYSTLEDLQTDWDVWIGAYNTHRTHSGKCCYGRTPMQTFTESLPLAKEKMLDELPPAA